MTASPPTVTRFAAGAPIDAMTAALDRHGAIIIERLFDDDVIGAIRDDLAPVLKATVPAGGAFLGHSTKAIPGLLAKAPSFSACLEHPTMLAFADHVLLPNCRRYQLQITSAQEVWAGGKQQAPHRDENVYGPVLDYGPEAPHYVIGMIVAGSEFTADNGATRVAPGSHLWPPDRVVTEDELVAAAMPKGSVLVYFGRTIHFAGRNITEDPRLALIFGYSVGWLRQEENILIECSPAYARSLPERVQQLIGYEAYSPIVGWAAGCDPDLLTRPAPPDYVWPSSENVA